MRLDPNRLKPERIVVREANGHDPAVVVIMAPIGMRAWREAQAVVSRGIAAAGGVLTDDVSVEVGDAMSLALISAGILGWEGVGGADGEPIEPSAETIPLFLADPRDFDEIDRQYVVPFMNREREKNGSSPSSNGTSGAAMGVPDIASSPAVPTAPVAAPNARTRSTSRKAKKPRPSRTS